MHSASARAPFSLLSCRAPRLHAPRTRHMEATWHDDCRYATADDMYNFKRHQSPRLPPLRSPRASHTMPTSVQYGSPKPARSPRRPVRDASLARVAAERSPSEKLSPRQLRARVDALIDATGGRLEPPQASTTSSNGSGHASAEVPAQSSQAAGSRSSSISGASMRAGHDPHASKQNEDAIDGPRELTMDNWEAHVLDNRMTMQQLLNENSRRGQELQVQQAKDAQLGNLIADARGITIDQRVAAKFAQQLRSGRRHEPLQPELVLP